MLAMRYDEHRGGECRVGVRWVMLRPDVAGKGLIWQAPRIGWLGWGLVSMGFV